MSVEKVVELIPDYAKDLRLNLTSMLRQTELTGQQLWGTVVACAMASRSGLLLEELLPEAQRHLSPEAYAASKSAAAIMGMNNIFYRFGHLSSNQKYAEMPARLRMNVIRTHGSNPVDFELWCLAVSAINGCGTCVDSHEKVLREKGVGEEVILASVRIGAVIHAIAAVLDTESFVEDTDNNVEST